MVLLQCVTWSFRTEDPADGRLLHATTPVLKPHHSTGLSSELGISYRAADGSELHMIGGLAGVDTAESEARRGLQLFGADHALIYRGRTAHEGELLRRIDRT